MNNTQISKFNVRKHIDALNNIEQQIVAIKHKDCIMNYDDKSRMIGNLQNQATNLNQLFTSIVTSGMELEFKENEKDMAILRDNFQNKSRSFK